MDKLKFLLKSLLLMIAFFNTNASVAQVYEKNIANYILNIENPYSFLQRIEKIGIKEVGNKALDSAYLWLVKTVEQVGYKPNTQKFLYNKDTLRNIEFIKRGDSDSCIVIGAHYDSKDGPGVNDNGTGNFALYQIAKWVKNLRTKYTIRFIYFSGEEIDYLGSKYYIKNRYKDSVKIKFMLNLDQLGGTLGEDNSGIKCERDESSSKKDLSSELTVTLARFFSLYTNLNPKITPAYLSDYLSFRDSGCVITGLYQYSSFPYYHTESDLLIHVDLAALQSIVKGALAFILDVSKAEVPAGVYSLLPSTNDINVYNTGNELMVISNQPFILKIYDYLGHQINQQQVFNSDTKISLIEFKAGVYFAYVCTQQNVICKKFLVKE